jgi:hypothetical protein
MSQDLWGKPIRMTAEKSGLGPASGAAIGSAPIKRQIFDYYSNRQSRFYYRGLLRDGICLGDPFLFPIEVAALCDPDLS